MKTHVAGLRQSILRAIRSGASRRMAEIGRTDFYVVTERAAVTAHLEACLLGTPWQGRHLPDVLFVFGEDRMVAVGVGRRGRRWPTGGVIYVGLDGEVTVLKGRRKGPVRALKMCILDAVETICRLEAALR